MNLEQIVARIGEIDAELAELRTLDEDEGAEFTEDDQTRFDELGAEFDELDEKRGQAIARQDRMSKIRAAVEDPKNTMRNEAVPDGHTPVAPIPGMHTEDPFDLDAVRSTLPGDMRARALTAVEQVRAVDDDAKAEMTRKLERVSDPRGIVPELILRTSSDEYRSAWAKAMAGIAQTFTAEEARAVAAVKEFEARTALSLTQSAYAVPAVVDPSVVLTSSGSTNPFRANARVETITANSWKAITSGGIAASWDGEAAAVSDDSPTLAQPEITAYKAQAFAIGSVEMANDWAAVGAELGREFADAKDQLEAAAFATGTGSSQPIGITKALDGGTSEQDPATAETFAIADVYATVKGVPPRFRGAGSRMAIMANLGTINAIRQFATADNYHAFLTDLGGGQPQRLLGYPLYEASTMKDYDDFDAAATADNFLIVAGDWSKYVIVDRIGMAVEYVPHMFDTTAGTPTGQRGWYAYWRVGADSLVDGAFNMLSIPTTA